MFPTGCRRGNRATEVGARPRHQEDQHAPPHTHPDARGRADGHRAQRPRSVRTTRRSRRDMPPVQRRSSTATQLRRARGCRNCATCAPGNAATRPAPRSSSPPPPAAAPGTADLARQPPDHQPSADAADAACLDDDRARDRWHPPRPRSHRWPHSPHPPAVAHPGRHLGTSSVCRPSGRHTGVGRQRTCATGTRIRATRRSISRVTLAIGAAKGEATCGLLDGSRADRESDSLDQPWRRYGRGDPVDPGRRGASLGARLVDHVLEPKSSSTWCRSSRSDARSAADYAPDDATRAFWLARGLFSSTPSTPCWPPATRRRSSLSHSPTTR